MMAASKVPMLKPGEFKIWRIWIEQYIQMIDYALWDVIENDFTFPKTHVVEGLGYNAVPPPHTSLFMPPKPDLSYIGLEEFTSEPAIETLNAKTSEDVPKKVVKPVWKYNQRVNHKNFAKNTDPCPKRNTVPKAVLMKSGIKSVNAARQIFSKAALIVDTARPVNTAHPKTTMNAAKPRPKTIVNIARPKAVLNAIKGNEGNPQMDLQKKRSDSSGCSRHITENMSYITDYEEIDRGYVAFGDHLDKFDGKADEGLFVRYSLNSKAFRVFNSRTKRVEETLHISQLLQVHNLGQARKKKEPGKDYILLPLWTADPPFPQEPKSFMRPFGYLVSILNTLDPLGKFDGKADEGFFVGYSVHNLGQARKKKEPGKDYILLPLWTADPPFPQEPKNQEEKDSVNNTNKVNAVSSTVNAASNEVNDERGITIRNEARLVAQGHTQEEGIDYNEVFAPVARIEAIRLFLAYASFKDFVVYQMDMKSAFLYENIKEEKLCTSFEKLMHDKFQMSSMGELTFFLGLQVKQKDEDIFISQDKYVVEILKKFGFSKVKTASTPMETQKHLLKDEDGEEVDVHIYRLMIGSLMYLTSLRPDIMFAVCVVPDTKLILRCHTFMQ
nr:hypothetical protein [Tanacetum cinerariifolium]